MKNIGRIQRTNDDIAKAVNKAKGKRVKQMDAETPGGFVEPDDNELKEVIDSKLVERIQQQNDLRKVELGQTYAWYEIDELQKIYKGYDDMTIPKPTWFGMKMPKNILAMEINCKLHDWKIMMSKRNYMIQALENVGFNKAQVKDILVDGKIISDKLMLKEMEANKNKKKKK